MPVIASNHKLLEILPEEERQALERLCPPRRFKKGSPIYRYQDRADDLYIVLEGKVKISVPTPDGGERILSILGPGDFFGESFLSGQERHTSEAVAVTERVVASPVCADKIIRMPNVALSLARVLASRVQELESQLEATTAPVGARVGNAFLAFARRFGEKNGDRTSVKLDLTHEELAAFVGSTRVTVTNALGELRDLGLVEGTRGQYEIDVPALEQYVESQGLVQAA